MSEERVRPFSSDEGLIEWGDRNCQRCRRESCDLVLELEADYGFDAGVSMAAARRIGWDAEYGELAGDCAEREP